MDVPVALHSDSNAANTVSNTDRAAPCRISASIPTTLVLSGGGFRATLFHLGIVKALRDAKLLVNVADVCGVSGGSIVAAHLVLHWERYTGSDAAFQAVSTELIQFARSDVRNRILRRLLLHLPAKFLFFGRSLERLRPNATKMLIHAYRGLFGRVCLGDPALAKRGPTFHLLATNLTTGELCSFSQSKLVKHRRDGPPLEFSATTVELALAVGASSAFPAFFPPVAITTNDLEVQSREQFQPEKQYFIDGGVFDNLGIRKLHLLAGQQRIKSAFVSDAGGGFDLDSRRYEGIVDTALRSTDILMKRIADLEASLLDERAAAGPKVYSTNGGIGAVERSATIVARIGDRVENDPTALPVALQILLKSIRTDLDTFSPTEIRALTRHGYCVARKHIQAAFGSPLADPLDWEPLPKMLHRQRPIDEEKRALARSAQRRFRLWSWRDWVSYVFLGTLLSGIAITGVVGYRLFYEVSKALFITSAFEQSSQIEFLYGADLAKRMALSDKLAKDPLDGARAVAGKTGAGDLYLSNASLRGVSYYTFPGEGTLTIMDIQIRKQVAGLELDITQRANDKHAEYTYTLLFSGANGEYTAQLRHPRDPDVTVAIVKLSGLYL